MSEIDNTLIENSGKNNKTKLSVFSELNGASIGVGIGLTPSMMYVCLISLTVTGR